MFLNLLRQVVLSKIHIDLFIPLLWVHREHDLVQMVFFIYVFDYITLNCGSENQQVTFYIYQSACSKLGKWAFIDLYFWNPRHWVHDLVHKIYVSDYITVNWGPENQQRISISEVIVEERDDLETERKSNNTFRKGEELCWIITTEVYSLSFCKCMFQARKVNGRVYVC
jgi:hypothetical protein